MRMLRVIVVFFIILCGSGMAAAQTVWVEHPDSPLIGPGEPGEWDDGGHWLSHVVFDGSIYHMWFTGIEANGDWWDLGHATSADGVAWTMDPENPVLIHGEYGEWDDWGITDVAVVYDGTLFHMWYGAFHHDWTGGGGYATSPDGTAWTKHPDNPVLTPGPAGSWYASGLGPSSVILDGDTYRMWCPGMDAGGTVGIGYAESSDGIEWVMHPVPVLEVGKLPGAFDSALVGHPSVVFDGDLYHMWYFGSDGQGLRKIGYAYSSDGIQWVKHRGNPVLQSPTVEVDLPHVIIEGTTFRMWYTNDDTWISYATSDCCWPPDPLLDRQVIPAVAYAAGAEGSFYETTLDLNNSGIADAEVRFLWMPRGASNTDPVRSEPVTVAAGESVRYANVLAEVFDLEPNTVGALGIESTSEDLLAIARVANTPQEPNAGSFGQPLEAIRTFDCTGQDEKRRLLFATEHADLRFNVGCFNASDEPAQVSFELYRADGTMLGTESLDLAPWGNDQLNRIFDPYHPVTGYVDYWSDLPQGSIYCYGSLLDNVTSDPTTIPPR